MNTQAPPVAVLLIEVLSMITLGVLSKSREIFPTQQLLVATQRFSGVKGVYLPTHHLRPIVTSNQVDLLLAEYSLNYLQGVIPRVGYSQTELGVLCIQQFERMDILTTLASQALYRVRDKFRCFQYLADRIEGLQLPRTELVLSATPILLEKTLSSFTFPVVIKVPAAAQGTGAILAPTQRTAREIIDALFVRSSTPILVQEYLQATRSPFLESEASQGNRDIRVFVVGETILGAMERRIPAGWRTNVAQGGEVQVQAAQLSTEEEEIIHQVMFWTEMEVAGLDFVPTAQGLALLEVNACPGWKAFELAHPHVQVASQIISYLLEKIRC